MALYQDLDRLFVRIAASIGRAHPDVDLLNELIRYQRQIVMTPEFDPQDGIALEVLVTGPAYFAAARGLKGGDAMPEPKPMPPSTVLMGERRSGDPGRHANQPGYYEWDSQWYSGDPEGRTARWIEAVVRGRNFDAINTVSDLAVAAR